MKLKQATAYQSEVKAVQIAAELVLNLKEGPAKCNLWLDNQAIIYELGNHAITQKCVMDAHRALLNLCKDGTSCDINSVRISNLGLYFFAFKCCVSQLSVD